MDDNQDDGGVLDWLTARLKGLDAGLVIENGKVRQAYAGAGTTPSFWRDIAIGVAVGFIIRKLL